MSTQEKLLEAAKGIGSMFVIRDHVSRLALSARGPLRSELDALRSYLDSLLTIANNHILNNEYDNVVRISLRVCRLVEMTLGDLGVRDETIDSICASLLASRGQEPPPIQ